MNATLKVREVSRGMTCPICGAKRKCYRLAPGLIACSRRKSHRKHGQADLVVEYLAVFDLMAKQTGNVPRLDGVEAILIEEAIPHLIGGAW